MPQQTILILGGGVGGVVAAKALRRRLHRRHRVVLVEREPTFTLAASFLLGHEWHTEAGTDLATAGAA